MTKLSNPLVVIAKLDPADVSTAIVITFQAFMFQR